MHLLSTNKQSTLGRSSSTKWIHFVFIMCSLIFKIYAIALLWTPRQIHFRYKCVHLEYKWVHVSLASIRRHHKMHSLCIRYVFICIQNVFICIWSVFAVVFQIITSKRQENTFLVQMTIWSSRVFVGSKKWIHFVFETYLSSHFIQQCSKVLDCIWEKNLAIIPDGQHYCPQRSLQVELIF